MGFFSVVSFAANPASGCSGAGPGVMIVPAPCALLYAGSEGFKLNLYILAKEMEPFGNCLSLGHRQGHDARAGQRVLVQVVELQRRQISQ